MIKMKSKFLLFFIFASFANHSLAAVDQSKGSFEDKFRQLDEVFPFTEIVFDPSSAVAVNDIPDSAAKASGLTEVTDIIATAIRTRLIDRIEFLKFI